MPSLSYVMPSLSSCIKGDSVIPPQRRSSSLGDFTQCYWLVDCLIGHYTFEGLACRMCLVSIFLVANI